MLTNELLLKTSFLPILVYDLETFKIAEVNQSAIDHYGYSHEEFVNMTIKDLRPAKS